jgi:hypothetical protein
MSYWKQTTLTDIIGDLNRVSSYGEALIVEPVRLAGAAFIGTTVDPNFWTATVTGTGTVTQSNGQQVLATGATANSTAVTVTPSIARYVASSQNRFLARIQMGDTGTANNTRRWGAFNGTDGAYFKLAGTVLSVCTMDASSETAVASTSWNGNQTVPTLTSLNFFEIVYTVATVIFLINGNVAHTVSATAAPWASTSHFPAYASNVNSGGGTANVTMDIRVLVITRLGRYETQPKYGHVTTANTYILKYGAGVLHRLTIATPTSAGSAAITVYDNTAGSGTVISVVSLPSGASAVTLEYMVPFNIGLTVVSTGTWDATVIYE